MEFQSPGRGLPPHSPPMSACSIPLHFHFLLSLCTSGPQKDPWRCVDSSQLRWSRKPCRRSPPSTFSIAVDSRMTLGRGGQPASGPFQNERTPTLRGGGGGGAGVQQQQAACFPASPNFPDGPLPGLLGKSRMHFASPLFFLGFACPLPPLFIWPRCFTTQLRPPPHSNIRHALGEQHCWFAREGPQRLCQRSVTIWNPSKVWFEGARRQ